MAKKNKGPRGAAAYSQKVKDRGLDTVMKDVAAKVKKKAKRTASVNVRTVMNKARSY